MRETFRGFLTVSPLTLAAVATAFVQAKALAVLIGPQGTGFFSLAITLNVLLATIGGLGISSALVKLIAEYGASGKERDIWRIAGLGLGATIATGALITLVVTVNSGAIADLFLGDATLSDGDKRFIVVAAALGTVPSLLVPSLAGALRGLRDLRPFVTAGVITAVLSVIAVVLGAVLGDERGAFLGFLCGQLCTVLVLLLYALRVSRKNGIPVELRGSRQTMRPLAKSLLRLGALSLAAGLAAAIGQNLVRSEIAGAISLTAVGLFSAAWSISNRLPTLIYKTMTAYVLPEISALRDNWTRIIQLQNDAARISILVATPVLALAIAASPWVISVLLTDEFLPATGLVRLMLVGELFSIIAWAATSALFASGRAGASASFEWAFWIIFVVGAAIAVAQGDLTAIGAAYALSQLALASMAYAWERRHHGFRWRSGNALLIALSTCVVCSSAALSALTDTSTLLAVAITAAGLCLWAVATVSRKEWSAARHAAGRLIRRLRPRVVT